VQQENEAPESSVTLGTSFMSYGRYYSIICNSFDSKRMEGLAFRLIKAIVIVVRNA